MTPEARASLAEQLLANDLFSVLFTELEQAAVERMIYAPDEETRAKDAMRVQAIRSLRTDCEACLRNNRKRKAAPA